MRDLQTIRNINADSQAKHFIARLNQLKEFKPDGFTMDLYGNEVKRNSGFVVAFQEVNQDTLELIIKQSFLDNNQDKRFVGGWVDAETGKFYLDWVTITEDIDNAFNIAKRNNQLAIYDFGKKEVIYL